MKEALIVMVFGALGALCRFGVGEGTKQLWGDDFPYGTLIANVVGCFIIGVVMRFTLNDPNMPIPWKTGIVVGFLGAFTTFSAFGYATYDLMRQGIWTHAFINCAANLLLGLGAVWLGVVIGRTLTS